MEIADTADAEVLTSLPGRMLSTGRTTRSVPRGGLFPARGVEFPGRGL